LGILAVDLANRRRGERGISKRFGENIGVNMGLGQLFAVCRDRNQGNGPSEVENSADDVRDVYEMAVVGALEKQVEFKAKLKVISLALLKISRKPSTAYLELIRISPTCNFGPDLFQLAPDINCRLHLVGVLLRRVLEESRVTLPPEVGHDTIY
jgi:hypothetical protein